MYRFHVAKNIHCQNTILIPYVQGRLIVDRVPQLYVGGESAADRSRVPFLCYANINDLQRGSSRTLALVGGAYPYQ